MQILRQSTQVVVRVGPFVDAADAVTPETGVTLGAADQAEALKAAGAATVDISSNTWAAISGADGWYNLTLSTTDTNTVGTLEIVVQDTSVCRPVSRFFQVVEEAVYDALYAASAGSTSNTMLPVNVEQVDASANSANSLATMFNLGGGVLTVDSGSTTTLVDSALTQTEVDCFKGWTLVIRTGNAAVQTRLVTAFNPTTDTLTFEPALSVTLAAGNTYVLLPAGRVDVARVNGVAPSVAGTLDTNITHMNSHVLEGAGVEADPWRST